MFREALSFPLDNFFPDIRLLGHGVNQLVKHLDIQGVRCASNCPKDRFICTSDRAHDRSSSPRLAASGPQN